MAEAQFCISQVKKAGLGKDIYIFADFEYDTVNKAKKAGVTLGKAECNKFTEIFCSYVKSQGYKTGIYTNIDYYKNWYSKSLLSKYPVWLADYEGGPDFACIIQQFTSSGRVAGISGNVDMDHWYTEGTTILWRVRTAGVTGTYGAWSVQRTINVYAVPTVQLNVTDSTDSELTTLESFPFRIKAETAPDTQSVLSYHVSITSTQTYSTSDRTGTETVISRGQEVYSLFTDGPQNLLVELNAGNIDLENNITYKVTCTASFDSGLTASAESEFDVGWTEQTYGINAEIGYDSDTYSCSIRAYCADEENKLIPGVTLAIYRRDYTGELIEIASELDNSSYTYVTDPHPALDYGRYRIVATEVSTGAISYYDVPPYPIKETSIIIQWEETWDNLVTEGLNERDIVMEPLWSGSLVKLPYNIDVSDKNGVDVSLVEYIGRKRPVSYYGTQLGETSSWKTEIPRGDIDTLYALRRLAVYSGDVYIREPSGTGYWANVAVSISQTHCEVKIPVSFDITRVEGGI